MPSLLDSPPKIPAGAGAWSSLYAVQEPVKPRHMMVFPAVPVAKKPAYYGGRKKNLETCTEALGCETGAVDAAPLPACNGADDKGDAEEAGCAERKRRAREEEEETETETEGRARQAARRPLPPPLTTLARGASRVRLVHERRDGRLAMYAVRTHGMEAERSAGRLRMRLISHPTNSSTTACRRQEPQEAEAKEEVVDEAECGVAKYVCGGRCVEPEGSAAVAARRGPKQWEQEQAAAFLIATS